MYDDEEPSDPDSVVLLPTTPGGIRRASSLTADIAFMMAAVALALALYHHVPSVRAVAIGTWRVVHPDTQQHKRSSRIEDFVHLDRPRRPAIPKPGDREEPPEPTALVAPLAVTQRTPRVAVTTGREVTLHAADGTRIWWHAAQEASFAPTGGTVLVCGSGGWGALDCRSGRRLKWSEALAWIPQNAQIKWSPSSRLVAFEWAVDGDAENMAIGVLDCSRSRWLAQTALTDGVVCAESFAWSPDERYLAMPTGCGLLLLRTSDGRIKAPSIRNEGDDVLWHPDSQRLVTRGDADWDDSCGVLETHDLRSGRHRATTVDGISSYVTPLAWMDGGRALIYDSMCEGTWDGAPRYLARWPSGEEIAQLGNFGEPKVDRSGGRVAIYDLDAEAGGAGVLRVCSIGGKVESLDGPENLVGIPLKWLVSDSGDGGRGDAEVIDWLLDYAWDPRGADLYLLARRGARAWCVWKWEPESGAPKPVGQAVDFPRDARRGADCNAELVFPPSG